MTRARQSPPPAAGLDILLCSLLLLGVALATCGVTFWTGGIGAGPQVIVAGAVLVAACVVVLSARRRQP